MAKRMIFMVTAMAAVVAALGFIKFRQFQVMAEQFAAMQPPPEAVTTIVARDEHWASTLSAIASFIAIIIEKLVSRLVP